jgi:hypothetical protein
VLSSHGRRTHRADLHRRVLAELHAAERARHRRVVPAGPAEGDPAADERVAVLRGQAISATTATAIGWNNAIVNSDSGWASGNNTRYTAQTPAYYLFEAVWQSTSETSAGYRGAYFRVTTGSNNPGGAGNTTSFGASRPPNVTSATGADYTAVGAAMLSPYLYVLDYVELIAYSSHAETVGFSDGGSYMTVTLVSI